MSRISAQFDRIKTSGKKGFIPFVTAGDPDPAATLEILLALANAGSTVIELGVPFSDPMADGPVIQASSQRALERHNTSVLDVLEIVSEFRKSSETPLILFGYLNPFLQFGIEKLADEAAKAGVDGFLITDIVDGEFETFSNKFAAHDLDLISLIAPTTSEKRLEVILGSSRGFVYAISTTGVTGSAGSRDEEAEELVKRARKHTDLPIAVGFGVATAGDVDRVLKYADAAVVGSALVKIIASAEESPAEDAKKFVESLLS